MRTKIATSLTALLLASAINLLPGCGLATAPVSVPEAIAKNASFSFEGQVVDQDGKPLDGVLMAKHWSHHLWTPIAGATDTNENGLLRIDKPFSVNERGTDLHLAFTKDGYQEAKFDFYATDSDYVTTPSGEWRNAKNFPVILYATNKTDEVLYNWDADVNCEKYPTVEVVDLNSLPNPSWQITRSLDVSNAGRASPGHFYLSLVKEAPPAIDSKGNVDPTQVNVPGNITLHITGPDGGFVRIEPRLGFSPFKSSDMAPTSGYNPELTIDRNRLVEMRSARKSRVIEAHEYFFFKANGHYGKGMIEWKDTVLKTDKAVHPVSFHVYFWMQLIRR